MQLNKKRIGILGGTFDPIHLGHLQLAIHAMQQLELDEVRFIPCRQPVLKSSAIASAEHRLAMINLAIAEQEKFILDTRELESSQPSYSILTAQSLVEEFPQAEFFWLMGEDAFAGITQWHQWKQLANYCHIVVMRREHILPLGSNEVVENYFLSQHKKILSLDTPYIDIASTSIRHKLQQSDISVYANLPENVLQYILKNHLYQIP